MRIALISLDQHWLNKDENYRNCEKFVAQASSQGCELIIFPEMTLTGYSLDMQAIAELNKDAPTLQRFKRLAASTQTHIIFGACLFETTSAFSQNALCLATPKNDARLLYTKTHPFSFSGENKNLIQGEKLGMVDIGALHLGCSICYDLRFPEIYSVMAKKCNAIVNIANWPASRITHWTALLVARAIENQLFVLGVNRTGADGNDLVYIESSIVIRPDGSKIEPVYSEKEMKIYDIDLAEAEQYRQAFPTIKDKRYSFYRKLYAGDLG